MKIGDVVECVSTETIICHVHRHTGLNVKKGRLYRVHGFRRLGCGCDALMFGSGLADAGLATRFRPIRGEQDKVITEAVKRHREKINARDKVA